MERTNGITKKQSQAMVWIFIFLLAVALFLDVGLTLIPVFGWEGAWGHLASHLVNETPFLFIFELLTLSGISFQFHPITLLLWIPCLLEMVLPMTFFLVSRRGFKKRQIWLLAVPGVFIVLRLCSYIMYLFRLNISIRFTINAYDYAYNFYNLSPIISSCVTVGALALLCIGLNKKNHSILKASFGIFLAFAIINLLAAGNIQTLFWIFNDRNWYSYWDLFTFNSLYWPKFMISVLFMYALIAYYTMKMQGVSLIKHRKIEKTQTEFMRGDGEVTVGNKSKVVAALLAFFLGTTGAHRYYLGYKKQGIIQTCGFVSLIIGWSMYVPAMISENVASLLFALIFLIYGGITSIWAFVDFIRILTGGLKPEDGSDYTENQPRQVQVIQTSPSAKDNIDALEKLAKLREQGVLTEEEFQQKKADILGHEYAHKTSPEAKPQGEREWICVKCNTANKGTAKFCSQCGEVRHLDWKCAKCGESNSANARFCCNCGVSQEESERIRREAEEEERKRLEEERRLREEEECKRLEEERRLREEEERKRLEEERRGRSVADLILGEKERKRLEEERRIREEEERRKAEEQQKLKEQGYDYYPHPLKFYDGVCPKCGLKYYNDRSDCIRCGARFKQED